MEAEWNALINLSKGLNSVSKRPDLKVGFKHSINMNIIFHVFLIKVQYGELSAELKYFVNKLLLKFKSY